ncbi:hypothetical protein GJ496_003884 [Pomphorhynchus laevis]|nr:hypothetical protein GJ496_003884 [Pomphorhynchus laevis]
MCNENLKINSQPILNAVSYTKYAQVQSNDRPIVLGQPLLTFPINDQAVGTFRRSGSSEDMRRFTRISMAERTINSKPRRHSRDFVRTIVDNQVCKPCGTNVSLQIPSLERPLSFTEFLLSSNYHTFDAAHGNELRESLMSALRTEHVDDPSLEFVTVTPSVLSEHDQKAIIKNELHILHSSLNARDFNVFLERMLEGGSKSSFETIN